MATRKDFRELNDKREEMVEFLLENIVARETERIGNDVVVVPYRGKPIYVKTISIQRDFKYDFEPDPTAYNTEFARLNAIKEKFAKMIGQFRDGTYKPMQGQEFIPAFVLMTPEVDRKQLTDERTFPIVNHGNFLKQELANDSPWNLAKLDPLEVALMYFHRFEQGQQEIISLGLNREFSPGITYFNPEQHWVRDIYFSDSENSAQYARANCVSCDNPNGPEYNHSGCKHGKKKGKYIAFARQRNKALYHKYWMTAKTRKQKVINSTSIEDGIRFRPFNIDAERLRLDNKRDDLYIAVIK